MHPRLLEIWLHLAAGILSSVVKAGKMPPQVAKSRFKAGDGMIVVSEDGLKAFSARLAGDQVRRLAEQFLMLEPALASTIERASLARHIARSIDACGPLNLETEGSVLLYATLALGAAMDADGETRLSEAFQILRDTNTNPEIRQERATMMLVDLDQSMPEDLRNISVLGTPDLALSDVC